MLRNFITIALRNLNRFRFYTIINIFGLTVGITACLVILIFIKHELSYDTFNENADRIYRVEWDLKFGPNSAYHAAVTPPMADVLVRDYPEIEAAARFRDLGAFSFKRDIQNVIVWPVVYADNDIFNIFTIPFVSGNPKNALTEPNTLVITESCAKQFFKDEDPVGKTLIADNTTLYKITGVVADMPENSHFHYRMFLSMEGLDESKTQNWIGGPYNTYILLKEGSDAKHVENKIQSMVTQYLIPHAASVFGAQFMQDFRKGGNSLRLPLRPLLDIHLHSHLTNELEPNGNIDNIYLLGAVAIFTLLIACINFINLATARSVKRAREVGIRKVLGSSRRRLAFQFLAESIIVTLIATILGIVFTEAILPIFNAMTGLSLNVHYDLSLLFALGLIILIAGVLAGLYPGFVLASYQPAIVLKGNLIKGSGSAFLRSSLVVVQFVVSITLIITTLALNAQMKFVQDRYLGFTKGNVIMMLDMNNYDEKLEPFRQEILRDPMFINATISSYFPGPESARNTPLFWKSDGLPRPETSVNMEKWAIDYDYVPTLAMEVVAGRNFSNEFPSDSSAVILNEEAVRKFGFKDDAIGQKISMFHQNADGTQDVNRIETWTVVGVVKDFNFESLRQRVSPLGFFLDASNEFMAFRYNTSDTEEVIKKLESAWKKVAPGEPFSYSFLNSKFDKFYKTDQKMQELFVVFAVLAIILACLGLFALTAFIAEQRTKEIGIRKVMGATSGDVVLLLSRKFSSLVIIAFLLAIPAAAFFINWYLQQFVYRTSIGIIVYIAAGTIALVLAFVTMAYQAISAAMHNPVDSLRSE